VNVALWLDVYMLVSSIIQIHLSHSAFHNKLWLRCLYTTFVQSVKVKDNKDIKGTENWFLFAYY